MSVILPLLMQQQAQTNWCWAAVAASVGDYLKAQNPSGSLTQCEIVNAALSQPSCCDDGSTDECNRDYYLETALELIGHLNTAPYLGTASFDSIRTLTSPPYNLPIGVRVSNGANGHFLLIVGFNDENGNQWVRIADPCYGPGTYDINEFTSGYQGAVWTETYPIK